MSPPTMADAAAAMAAAAAATAAGVAGVVGAAAHSRDGTTFPVAARSPAQRASPRGTWWLGSALGPLLPAEHLPLFLARLMKQNVWTEGFARRAMEEYYRFLFLIRLGKGALTPSQTVDQVWHLHLQDTAAYSAFCDAAFGRFVHHKPSRGGADEAARMAKQYNHCLDFYREIFGAEPPKDIWPPPFDAVLDGLNYLRMNPVEWRRPPRWVLAIFSHAQRTPRRTAVALGGAIFLATCQLSGGNFLLLELTLGFGTLAYAALTDGPWEAPEQSELDVYEFAELTRPLGVGSRGRFHQHA